MNSSRWDAELVDVVGIPVSAAALGRPVERFGSEASEIPEGLVTFVNSWACALARAHDDYVSLLSQFDQVCCDGIGMVKAAHVAGLKDVVRESFDDTSVGIEVLDWAADCQLTVGLVGGAPGVAEQAADVLSDRHKGVVMTPAFSGFGKDLDAAMTHHVNSKTALVICGMGSPQQERFLVGLREAGWKGLGLTCGGFMDQLLTGEQYYPDWVDRMNLRFAYRLYREPRRLWKRYLVDYQVFTWRFIQLCGKRLVGRGRPDVVKSRGS